MISCESASALIAFLPNHFLHRESKMQIREDRNGAEEKEKEHPNMAVVKVD